MNIYLYIKRHCLTHKYYFGKTVKDPLKYKGSGFYWLRHLKVHGPKVKTLWFRAFNDQAECTKFALDFSEKHDIVKSDKWLNLKPENGLDGTVPGTIFGPPSIEVRKKIAVKLKGLKKTDAHCQSLSNAHVNLPWSNLQRQKIIEAKLLSGKKSGPQTAEAREKVSLSKRGQAQKVLTCPYCKKSGGNTNMKRYHFSKCKEQ